jgi:glycerol-3-phosphate acyltransferase PlsY
MITAWLAPVLGYLLGSIPFGYLVVKYGEGRDIRGAGSGNIGAANVTRVVGLAAGALTLVLDAAKGYLAVRASAWLSGEDITWMMLGGLAAIAGHLFPAWLRFRGGRGVATGAGVFLPLCWPAVLGAMGVWVLVVLVWRYVSLASMVAAAALPPLLYLFYAPPYAPPLVVSAGSVLAAAAIILKHRANIQRLIAGAEPRFQFRRRRE